VLKAAVTDELRDPSTQVDAKHDSEHILVECGSFNGVKALDKAGNKVKRYSKQESNEAN
jgi:hypothetical protein